MDLEARKTAAKARIDDASDDLRDISLGIHSHPELNFDEHHAHRLLTDYLDRQGFHVERGAYGMDTAFKAVAGSGGPTLAVLCEYDALPGIGHACGHNLIAISGVATALALKEALGEGNGTVVVLGSPAEEGGGGKVALVRAGAFADVAAAMMVHPGSRTLSGRTSLASNRVELRFHVKAAHAAAQPDLGINALDGLIQTFNAMNAMRQQLRPDARVHGIVTSGGSAANIIPEYAAGKFSIRARDRVYQRVGAPHVVHAALLRLFRIFLCRAHLLLDKVYILGNIHESDNTARMRCHIHKVVFGTILGWVQHPYVGCPRPIARL